MAPQSHTANGTELAAMACSKSSPVWGMVIVEFLDKVLA